MSNIAELKKAFTIEIDIPTGAVTYNNKDNLSYTEVLGIIEYAKLMITKEWLDDLE
jgi:hypothetical protein